MPIKILNSKGVSMPLVIGLVTLLMVSSVAVSQLIIRGLQSASRIEASNRAYLAAEAGLEDALYELTPHFAGYETPPLGDEGVRNINFINADSCDSGTSLWCNEWEVESISSGETTFSGRFYANQKLMIYLYNDTNYRTDLPANAINQGPFSDTDIETINGTFSMAFKVPEGIVSSGKLKIDNDQDFDGSQANINEDPDEPVEQEDLENCPENPEDSDCDGKVNEDSEKDPVILWKMSDGAEKSLNPIRGCLSESGAAGSGNEKSELCEQEFGPGNDYTITLDQLDSGINENGEFETIEAFINRASADTHSKLLFEFLIVAPMEHMQFSGGSMHRIEIPYFEYKVDSSSDLIPYPFIRIKSDGYYRNFKQSLTTTITPKTTVPLFDFTIIQQE
ncbi:hypothetical protein KKA33_03130 [Patescibacteria group bacterium]|nr:hypothetical protein [Patescibacteria group bacterium]